MVRDVAAGARSRATDLIELLPLIVDRVSASQEMTMQTLIPSLALLACPVGMGLMMWFMAKGMRNDSSRSEGPSTTPVGHLREEHRRLGAEIDRLESQQRGPVAKRA